MGFESFDAFCSPSFEPLTHRSLTDSQCSGYLLLLPALLFQLPGSHPSFFSPIGFSWCSHTSYLITLYFLLPRSVDIGCGTGEFARLLASRAEHVLALDLSPQMIKLARERSTGSATIDFEAADALSWTFSPEQFDYIVSIATLHHMPMEAILPKMKEALAKGGTLVVLDICEARFSDLFVNLAAIPANLFMQRVKNGHRPAASSEARAAMEEHIAHDSYLTLSQVHQMCQALLPGASVRRHLFWRYSIVWTKPQ